MPIDLSDIHNLLTTYALPGRLRHALDYAGCLTLGDVLQLPPYRLGHFPKSGVATIQALLDFLGTGITVKELKQAKRMDTSFGEILGLATNEEALVDLTILKLRRISDEEIDREASQYFSTHSLTTTPPFEAFRMGARIARQWQTRLLAATKKLTPEFFAPRVDTSTKQAFSIRMKRISASNARFSLRFRA